MYVIFAIVLAVSVVWMFLLAGTLDRIEKRLQFQRDMLYAVRDQCWEWMRRALAAEAKPKCKVGCQCTHS